MCATLLTWGDSMDLQDLSPNNVIYVTVGTRTLLFKVSLTVEAVKKSIREGCVLQGGWLQLDSVIVVDEDVLESGKTYSFVRGISEGKSPDFQ